MFVAVIKCDFCKKPHEIKCRKSGDKPEVPEGWAVISPTVRIKGRPQSNDAKFGEWKKGEDDKYCYHPQNEKQFEALKKRKMYDYRRDKLRAKFDRNHVCLDCIEELLTGKISIKIGMGE